MQALRNFFLQLWENPTVQITLRTLLQLTLAAFLSGVIGYEREHSHRPAGFRTHILVAVGSALVMATSFFVYEFYGDRVNLDPTRLGAQVISGIGFLGAGTILREGFSVKGLTTAASLWAVSCIGLAVGAGFYSGAIVGTVVILITLNSLKKFVIRNSAGQTIYIEIADIAGLAPQIGSTIKRFGANLHSLEIMYADDSRKRNPGDTVVLKALFFSKNDTDLELILESIRDLEGVLDLYVD